MKVGTMDKVNEIILTGLSICWRVDYDKNGMAKGRHVSIDTDAREVTSPGRRIGMHISMSEQILERIKTDEELLNAMVSVNTDKIVRGYLCKGLQLGLELNVPDWLISLHEQLRIGLKRFCENEMQWYHIFCTDK